MAGLADGPRAKIPMRFCSAACLYTSYANAFRINVHVAAKYSERFNNAGKQKSINCNKGSKL